MLLLAGNAGSNTAADHPMVIQQALRQLPCRTSGRVGHKGAGAHRPRRVQPSGGELPIRPGHAVLGVSRVGMVVDPANPIPGCGMTITSPRWSNCGTTRSAASDGI